MLHLLWFVACLLDTPVNSLIAHLSIAARLTCIPLLVIREPRHTNWLVTSVHYTKSVSKLYTEVLHKTIIILRNNQKMIYEKVICIILLLNLKTWKTFCSFKTFSQYARPNDDKINLIYVITFLMTDLVLCDLVSFEY